MTSLAPLMMPGAQAYPTQWVTTSPTGPVISSPAAITATAWAPQPVMYAPQQQVTMLDALASALLAGAGQPGVASVMSGPIAVPVVPPSTSVMPAMAPVQTVAVASPQVQTLPAVAAPATEASPSTEAAAPAAPARSRARRSGTELWAGIRNPRAVHVSQVPSKYNQAPAAGNKDCGPASVVMTLKLIGAKIPGIAAGASPQRLINAVRALAGNRSNAAATTNHELGRALRAAGTETREIGDAASIRSAVRSGKPVILNGNPRHRGSYGHAFSAKQMTPYDGAHWIVVSGFDTKSGKYIINDPLSKVGPVKVTPAQLEAYRGGSIGIEVTA